MPDAEPSRPTRYQAWPVVALAGYGVILTVTLLAPTSAHASTLVGYARDLAVAAGVAPGTATQSRAEFVCNALILMPVSALGSAALPRTTWRDWTAVAFLVAGSIELAQGFLLPLREASAGDVVANTLGGLGGAAGVAVLRRLASPPRPRP